MADRFRKAATLRPAQVPPPAENAVPELSGGSPPIGHLAEFQRDPVSMLSRGWRECGELFHFRLVPCDFVLFNLTRSP